MAVLAPQRSKKTTADGRKSRSMLHQFPPTSRFLKTTATSTHSGRTPESSRRRSPLGEPPKCPESKPDVFNPSTNSKMPIGVNDYENRDVNEAKDSDRKKNTLSRSPCCRPPDGLMDRGRAEEGTSAMEEETEEKKATKPPRRDEIENQCFHRPQEALAQASDA